MQNCNQINLYLRRVLAKKLST